MGNLILKTKSQPEIRSRIMIHSISKVTLYVNSQEEAKAFWTEKAGFKVLLEQPMGPDMTWLEVGPSKGNGTAFVLYDKKMMMAQSPKTDVGHPSIILSTDDIESAHKELLERGVSVGEIMRMPYGSMFQFSDMDGNAFLLREDA